MQSWVVDPAQNLGLALKQVSEDGANLLQFNASEAVANTPQLLVYYEARTGERREYQFFRQGLNDRMGLAVNLGNGNLILEAHDFSLAGTNGFDFELERWHNSRINQNWFAGVGWENSLTTNVRYVFGDGSVDVALPSGDDAIFKPTTTGWQGQQLYAAPDGVDARLERWTSGGYTLTWNQSRAKIEYFSWGGLDKLKVEKGQYNRK